MLDLGTIAPPFRLPDFSGKLVARDDFKTAPALVVAINSNDLEAYPQDGPHGMQEEATTVGYTFPYLLDESQAVAKAYRAACTPDFYLFDSTQRLVYRGQFDSSRPNNGVPVTGA